MIKGPNSALLTVQRLTGDEEEPLSLLSSCLPATEAVLSVVRGISSHFYRKHQDSYREAFPGLEVIL